MPNMIKNVTRNSKAIRLTQWKGQGVEEGNEGKGNALCLFNLSEKRNMNPF